MKIENLNKANEIMNRLGELKKMMRWIENPNKNILILSSGVIAHEAISVSENMRIVIQGICSGEIARLEKEFEEL